MTTPVQRTGRRLRLGIGGGFVLLGLLLQAQPAGYPSAPQVPGGDLAVRLAARRSLSPG